VCQLFAIEILDQLSLFHEDILPELLTTNGKDEMMELSCGGSVQQMLSKIDLTEFGSRDERNIRFFRKSCKISVVISQTYLCEC
jgi:hypothetical protein